LLIRQPVEFPLYVSSTRLTDPAGAVVPLDPEQMTSLPPIRTVLTTGKKGGPAESLAVKLHGRLTEVGTIELWCSEVEGPRTWKLQFDVRSATQTDRSGHTGAGELAGFLDDAILAACRDLIGQTFANPPQASSPPPESLVKRLEQATEMRRAAWPPSLLRGIWETLFECESGRRRSAEHEARWLYLTGYSLRPGYGMAVDDWRVAQTWRLFTGKVQNPKNELCRAEWWILWRRIAGGLSAGQQLTLAEPLVAAVRSKLRVAGPFPQPKTAPFQYGPHETAEVYRLLGSLELLPAATKLSLGEALLLLLGREKAGPLAAGNQFALGRLASRVPVYGPLNQVMPAETAEAWVRRLLASPLATDAAPPPQFAFALVQMARRTDDRYRDLSDEARRDVLAFLEARGGKAHYAQLVRVGGSLEGEEQKLTFGEALPRGLRIE
jgi:hypothetical protein